MTFTTQQKAWLRGLELAFAGAVGSTLYEYFSTGGVLPHDKAGWLKLAGIATAAATGAVRLYLQKSPLNKIQ